MATSSKVRFDLDTLRTEAMKSLDVRIAQAQLEVDSYDDDEALAQRVAEWRTRQEEKISTIFRQLGDGGVDDYRLSKFSLDPIPEVDRYDRRNAEQRLERLLAKRSQVEAKAKSIKPDEDGTVSLTKTQLQEFFGL